MGREEPLRVARKCGAQARSVSQESPGLSRESVNCCLLAATRASTSAGRCPRPDPILGTIEPEPISYHRSRIDEKDDRTPVPPANTQRRGDIGREMNVVALHLLQAITTYCGNRVFACAVIKDIGRCRWLKLQVYRHAVPLICTDAQPVSSKATRCLSLRATTSSSSARVSGMP